MRIAALDIGGTYRVVIDGTEYMVELEEETERFR